MLVLHFCFFHLGSFWIQPAYKRGRHAGESYHSGQSSGCSRRKPGLWENERDGGTWLWSPGPPYRWDGFIGMSWYSVCTAGKCCAVSLKHRYIYFEYTRVVCSLFSGSLMSVFSEISLFLVCRQWSSPNEQPNFPPGLLNYTKNTCRSTSSRYMILFGMHLKLLMTSVFWLNISLFILLLVKSNPAKPTIASTMHVCREPQDDGYTIIPSPEKTMAEMNESELNLTLESSSDTSKRKKTPREVRSQKLIIQEFPQCLS